jgi:hypothetical protein
MLKVPPAVLISGTLLFASCERSTPQSHSELASDSSSRVTQTSTSSTKQSVATSGDTGANLANAGGSSTDVKNGSFSCTPNTFGPHDTLTLRMRAPHGDYLTATPPGGTVYFIVYPTLGEPTRRYSLVPSEAFKGMSTLRLPASVTATPRIAGRDTIPETFFARSGNYVLYLGQNMETDYPKSVSCRVRFIQDRK